MIERVEQQICIKVCIKLNITSQKIFRLFRRQQLWAAGDWQLHHNIASAHAWRLVQSFLVEHQITQVTQPPYIPDLVSCNFWLFPKLRLKLCKERDLGPLTKFRKIQQGSWWLLEELCEVLRCLFWRGLRRHCPRYNVSCIFLINVSIFVLYGWIPSGQISYTYI